MLKLPKTIQDRTTLNNGITVPWLGFGVFKLAEGGDLEQAVEWAIEAGYRNFDTAAYYNNEEGLGRALRSSGINREELFISTKLWITERGFENTLKAFEASRKRLGLDYIDLYLIHWPVPGEFVTNWRAMEKLYKEGLIRAIGISNFDIPHLKELIASSEIKPTVNQIEFHPYLVQHDLLTYCREQKIEVEAWSPLMRGRVLEEPLLNRLGEKYGKTAAQIVLRWNLEHGVLTIPKSAHKPRIQSNADIFDFSLTPEEVQAIDSLNRNERQGPGPHDFIEFMAAIGVINLSDFKPPA